MLSIESTAARVEITAVIRPNALAKTVRALEQVEQLAYTRWRALGRGQQHGIRVGHDDGATTSIEWLSKIVLSIVATEEHARAVVDAILEANQTGAMGDGRIFVCPLQEEVSIRTGGRCAVLREV